MSATIQETTSRQRRHTGAQSALEASTSTEGTTMSQTATAPASGAQSAAMDTTTLEIGGLSVTLPNRFSAMVGQPLTEDMSKIIFAHVSGQFRNNQNANAKARAERYGKAETDTGRKENMPLTVDDYLKIWADYMPNVGGAVRLSSMETMRLEAAETAWVKRVAAHNAMEKEMAGVATEERKVLGKLPIIAAAAGISNLPAFNLRITANGVTKSYTALPRKTEGWTDADKDAAQADWRAQKDAFLQRVMAAPYMAESVQAELDALIAKREAKKSGNGAAATPAPDSGDLL